MADKLFKTAEEIINGYPQLNRKSGRKVYLRGRALKTGNVSLYLYSNDDGKIYRQSLENKYILVPELTLKQKNQNKENLTKAELESDRVNDNVSRELAGLPQKRQTNILLTDYITMLCEQAKAEGRRSRWYELQSLCNHVAKCNAKIKLSNADAKFVREFIKYSETEAVDSHYTKSKPKNKGVSENTRWTWCRNLKSVFQTAIRAKLISRNPFAELESKELPHVQLDRRDYLDVEDVRKLMATECKSSEVKRVFLFCCFVGMRYGDVRKLTWREIGRDDNGLFVSTIQEKTHDPLKAYISKTAEAFMPQRNEAPDDAQVFKLPNNAYCNKVVKDWAKDAGVKKRITFHMSRHTAATMLLNLDTALEVVAKQLGHKRTATTEIYAKIVGRTQSAAISKQDDLFKDNND
jgi:integrase